MAYAITARHWMGDKEYIEAVLDSMEDFAGLGDGYAPGSRAIIADGGAAYMTDASGHWQELGSPGGGGSSVTVEPLTVTQNGTTTAPAGKAYNPVTVTLSNTYTVTLIEGTVAEPFGDENYSRLIADLQNGKVAIFAKPRFSTPTGGFLTASYWNDNVGLVLTDLQTYYPVEARYVLESLIGVCLQYDSDGELAMGFECDTTHVTLLSGSEALQLYIIRLSTGLWD